MKSTFVVAFCVLVVIGHFHGGDAASDSKSYEECLVEAGIKDGDLEKLKGIKDPKIRCIMACVLEKEGILKDGKIDGEEMKKSMTSEIPELDAKKTSELVDGCLDAASIAKEICDKGNIIAVCLHEELEKMNIKLNE